VVGRKSVHVLHSQLPQNILEYNPNDETFVNATKVIGGHDAVEEFMANGLWPLCVGLDLGEITEAEAHLSKVMAHLLQLLLINLTWLM
jgi:hypothetical protein